MREFSEWTRNSLEQQFKVCFNPDSKAMNHWMNIKVVISERETENLNAIQDMVSYRMDDWNEEEAKIKFIGPVFAFVNFETDNCSVYADRNLIGQVSDIQLFGVSDVMIAFGRQNPDIPIFYLHQYKRDFHREPSSHCLAAMLVSQAITNNRFPIYGCYVVGRMWYFMTLEGTEYSISNGFNVTKDDIFDVYRILKQLKVILRQIQIKLE